ncbi:MAG: YitT family protein [Clostridia bacterium]|nr:YitT family protein [Clostridia bacterium]MBR5984933.1 YitT family protein [Clostridia bacterium]MBR6008383.1 YitT family protein [Clostridia bacterium]
MKTFKRKDLVFAYGQILLGCLIGGAAYPLFMTPNNIAPGGVTGIGIILNYMFGLPVGTVSLVLNIPLFITGYRYIGRIFAFRSLLATALFSVCIDILPLKPMTDDMLLGTLFGGVMLGIGLGLILRGGATTGGTDMLARMVHHRLPTVTVGTFLFAFDLVVVVAAGFTVGTQQALYAIINIYVSGRIIDMVMVGFSGNKACFIMSAKWQEITSRLLSEMGRGVTQLKARGAYTMEEKPVVLCVVSRQEVTTLKRIVENEDPFAFMFISDAHEAIGEGFSTINEK